MEIPKSINVCGIPHNILLCDTASFGGDCLGEINNITAEIRINKDSPIELQHVTLIHEWVHGVLVAFGYNEESQNEHLVDALAKAINLTFSLKE